VARGMSLGALTAMSGVERGGMGIGLSVSRSIIESHQGRLWGAPNEGPGATLSFSIPHGPESSRVGVKHVWTRGGKRL